MPRPKSEITGSKVIIGLRMTSNQANMLKDFGGVQWLRNYLDRQIRSEQIQLGVSRKDKNGN
jgi:hypothetical protein